MRFRPGYVNIPRKLIVRAEKNTTQKGVVIRCMAYLNTSQPSDVVRLLSCIKDRSQRPIATTIIRFIWVDRSTRSLTLVPLEAEGFLCVRVFPSATAVRGVGAGGPVVRVIVSDGGSGGGGDRGSGVRYFLRLEPVGGLHLLTGVVPGVLTRLSCAPGGAGTSKSHVNMFAAHRWPNLRVTLGCRGRKRVRTCWALLPSTQ